MYPGCLLGRWANGIDRKRQRKLCVRISAVHGFQRAVFRHPIELRTEHLRRKGAVEQLDQNGNPQRRVKQAAHLLSLGMHSRLDPISTLDHVGLEADGTRSPVELEE